VTRREARNGPYNLFIDAANVAFYGQNYEGGGFNWGQVIRMVKKVDKEHPDCKLLVVSEPFMLYKIMIEGRMLHAHWIMRMVKKVNKEHPGHKLVVSEPFMLYKIMIEGSMLHMHRIMRMVKVDKEHPDRKLLVVSESFINAVQKYV